MKCNFGLCVFLLSASYLSAETAPLTFYGWKYASNQTQILRSEAENAVKAGDYAAAAERYAVLVANLPPSPQAQQAAIRSARCFAEARNVSRALELFDRVVAVGVALTTDDFIAEPSTHTRTEKLGKRLGTIRSWMEVALYDKAMLCAAHGLKDLGLGAIQYLQTEFPKSSRLPELYAIRAKMEWGTAEIETRFAADESVAAVRWLEIDSAFRGRDHKAVVQMADSLLRDWPQSGYVPATLALKAESLWMNGEYEAGRNVYATLLERLKSGDPDCSMARKAEYRIAWFDAVAVAKSVIMNNDPADTGWGRAHELCEIVRRYDPKEAHRAEMTLLRVELYFYRGQYVQAIEMSDELLRRFEHRLARKQGNDEVSLGSSVLGAHYFAALSMLRMGSLPEAADRFLNVVESCKGDSNANPGKAKVGASACYGLWLANARMGNEAGARSAERIMKETWPDSHSAQAMRSIDPRLLEPGAR